MNPMAQLLKTAKDEKTGPRMRVVVKGGAGAAVKGDRIAWYQRP